MKRFTNPFIWLRRIRHRCGYGVHSPFAYRFITEVLYMDLPYYAYDELDKELPLSDMFRVRKILHMLLRLSNWRQPGVIACLSPSSPNVKHYLHAGCKKAMLTDHLPEGRVDMCWLDAPEERILAHIYEHSVLILDHLDKHREWFNGLPSVVTFDLYDIGIAFFDTKYNKQHYIINF
ncbi:MAG: hypothetical protein J6W52_06340 [Bacteroidaceae bacterium]|nr:hypothetical protein [Bacteroidaceae bacterium]